MKSGGFSSSVWSCQTVKPGISGPADPGSAVLCQIGVINGLSLVLPRSCVFCTLLFCLFPGNSDLTNLHYSKEFEEHCWFNLPESNNQLELLHKKGLTVQNPPTVHRTTQLSLDFLPLCCPSECPYQEYK